MAVIPDVPGLTAQIVVNGEALKEYINVEEEVPAKTVVKYVEAISDAHFEVKWSISGKLKKKPGILVWVYMDGEKMDNDILHGLRLRNGNHKTCQGSYSRVNGRYYLQRFWFSKLRIDDTDMLDSHKITKSKLKPTGEVMVKFWTVKNIRPKPVEQIKNRTHKPATKFGAIPEKALKGSDELSHQGSLNAPEPTKSCRIIECDWIDSANQPFATFKFKYRSLAALKALHIIPRTPSPPPLEDRPFEDLCPEELKQLHEQFKAYKKREAVGPRVKKEKRHREDDSSGSLDLDEVTIIATKKRKLGNNADGAIEVDD